MCRALLCAFVSAVGLLRLISAQDFNVLFINDANNTIAKAAYDAAVNYIKTKPQLARARLGNVMEIVNTKRNSYDFVNTTCKEIDASIAAGKTPHMIIDTTLNGVSSEIVKAIAKALQIPTYAASYGRDNDIMEWRDVSANQEKYLVQLLPPGDVITEVIRSIVSTQNITSAAILYDESFVMEHRYKSLLVNIPVRHIITAMEKTDSGLRNQTIRIRDADVSTFFVVGTRDSVTRALSVATAEGMFGKKYAWFALTKDTAALTCASCTNASLVYMRPTPISAEYQGKVQQLGPAYSLTAVPVIDAAFYFDFALAAFRAITRMVDNGVYANYTVTTCAAYDKTVPPADRSAIDLRANLRAVTTPTDTLYGSIKWDRNGRSYQEARILLDKYKFNAGKPVAADGERLATWASGLPGTLTLEPGKNLSEFQAISVYRVTTAITPPFMMKRVYPNGTVEYYGYCVDLINAIKKIVNFDYELYEVPDGSYGSMDEDGNWNGMVKELIDKKADIALAPLSVMAERENVVDFTVPYYDLVGITILMTKPKATTSLFKFLTVLEPDVWFCILAAYFFTSFLLWIFDRYSPYSYQNNKLKYEDDDEKREFNLKECLWFCMTSLTPQGGGEAPKNLSGRLVAATWWLFGFIIIASYTANLAAFLTVSRLDTPIESLDDLSKQYKVRYAPLNGSASMTYFERMAYIESRFYEIWKDMSLNDSMSEVERAKLAVWDYPVSDKYTKMWQSMLETKLPRTFDDALSRVRASESATEGFAYLGDATDIRYQVLTNCDLQMVGDEFSRKPYAIAVQQGSPLKEQFNDAILKLLNLRELESLKEKWWNQNPEKKQCDDGDDQSDGISIYNIGGVFIVIFVGIVLACLTLAFEYWYYKYRNPEAKNAMNDKVFTVKEAEQKQADRLNEPHRRTTNYNTDFRSAWK